MKDLDTTFYLSLIDLVKSLLTHWTEVLTAIGTFGAVVLLLWKDILWVPKLQILFDPKSECIRDGQEEGKPKGVYLRVWVKNISKFIAQNVEARLEEVRYQDDNGTKWITYSDFDPGILHWVAYPRCRTLRERVSINPEVKMLLDICKTYTGPDENKIHFEINPELVAAAKNISKAKCKLKIAIYGDRLTPVVNYLYVERAERDNGKESKRAYFIANLVNESEWNKNFQPN